MAVPFEHRYYGEEIATYVVPRDGISSPTEAELLAHCRQRLPFSKCPKVIRFGKEVPYTSIQAEHHRRSQRAVTS